MRQNERLEDKRAGRPVNGDLNAAQEKLLIAENEAAAEVMRLLLKPPSTLDEDIPLLPPQHRIQVEQWLAHYALRKEIDK